MADTDQRDNTISDLSEQNKRLRSMVAEFVNVYWGEGDSDPHNPPDIIKRAKRLLKST